jgi:predicted metal-dependent enzyme (double-stranded beta helix superfamily)
VNVAAFEQFCERAAQQLNGTEPTALELHAIGEELQRMGAEVDVAAIADLIAAPGQERLHPIAVSASGGPSLYLVSDGAGTASPPHEHQTWVAIVGLRGLELNTLFRRADAATRAIVREREVAVGPGDLLVLDAAQIHSTRVDGEVSTVHLHLYGRALSALPPFSERCYEFEGERHENRVFAKTLPRAATP